MFKSSNRIFLRVVADIFLLVLVYNAPWYLTLAVLLIYGLSFFPYFEMIVFGSILDAYYAGSRHYLYTLIAIAYFIIIFLLQNRILLKNYVSIQKKKI